MGYSDFESTAEAVRQKTRNIIEGVNFSGVQTGYMDLDTRIHGLANGNVVVVGGRPSMGKTAFALNLMENIAVDCKKTALYFSLELSKSMLIERLLRQVARVWCGRTEIPTGTAREKLEAASEKIVSSPIIIDDKPEMELDDLVDRIRHYESEHSVDVIYIDYLQLINAERMSDSYQEQMAFIMKTLKNIAREIDKPIVVLSQLNRTAEWRADHHPMLADLRGSGCIEDEADTVLLLYRDEYYDCDSEERGIMEVDVAKDNLGYPGKIRLFYEPLYCKLSNIQ